LARREEEEEEEEEAAEEEEEGWREVLREEGLSELPVLPLPPLFFFCICCRCWC